MAKAQWVASSQTVGQPPTGVTVAYNGGGHTLADWQIVDSPTASGGKALKLMSSVSKLRMLWVDGVSSTGRVDVRARIYGVGPAQTLSPIFLAGKSTGSGAVCYGPYINSTRYGILRKYTPTAADFVAINGSGNNLLTSGNVWLGFRYTYDPAASPRHSIKVWREGFTTEESPTLYKTSDLHDAAIDGDRIGFGSQTIDTGSLLDWITIGTDGDDADVAPTGGATTPVAFSGSVSNQTGTEGVVFSLSLSTYFSGTETPFAYSVQAGTLPAGLSLNSSTGVISGTPTTAGVSSGIVIRATDTTPNTADTNSFSITINAAGDATPPTLTGAVTFTSVTQTSYTANWPAGSDNVAVTGYEYQIGSTAGAWTDAGNNLSAAITGRTAGATETVYVRNYDAAGLRSTPAISGSVTLESALAAGINVPEPLKNNTGTVLASQSGVRVAVLQAADLVSVFETSGLTANASGILATISDAAIIAGQQYHVAIKLADGGVGITGPITAS